MLNKKIEKITLTEKKLEKELSEFELSLKSKLKKEEMANIKKIEEFEQFLETELEDIDKETQIKINSEKTKITNELEKELETIRSKSSNKNDEAINKFSELILECLNRQE
ncbi:MAG: hypothetical protein K0B02_00260 [DPANN group archaeon]|nr:hypothetical protein [DPANN group archaeon]